MWICVWVFSAIPLISMSAFMLIPCVFNYCSSVVQGYSNKMRNGITPSSYFILQVCFSYSVLFVSPYEAENYL